jgi:chaperonin GroES
VATKIQPQPDYVVAKHQEAQAKTASGLYLLDNAKEKPKEALVVTVGKGVDGVKAGDKIIYKNSYEATEVKQGGSDYVIVHKENIVATLK